MHLPSLTATAAAAAIRDGDITAEAYASALVDAAGAGAALNAFVEFDAARVLEAARATDLARGRGDALPPLAGIPLAVKDNIESEGIVTTGGTPLLKNHVPQANAPVLAALIAAGASVMGKTTLHELAYGITSNNPFHGPARNPADPARIPGGSSGGSAVAVAAGMTPFALGTDTGGSVRIPAALCGVVGFRPSTGRWSQKGIVPISLTRDTAGPIARSVADAALLDRLVTGETATPRASLKGVRLGVPGDPFWLDLDPETEHICAEALSRLRDAGAELVEFDAPDIRALDARAAFPIALYETALELPAFLAERGIDASLGQIAERCASPDVRAILADLAAFVPALADSYREVMARARPELIETHRRVFAGNRLDALAFPTTPAPAPLIGEDETFELAGKPVPTFLTFVRNTGPSTIAGLPGISLPAGRTTNGLPVGLELDAPRGRDADLLGLAMAAEGVVGAVG